MDLALYRAVAFPSLVYRPRRPEQVVLHTIVRDHYETFRAQAAGRRENQGLPRFVERANVAPAMQGNGHAPPVVVRPAFVAPSLTSSHEAECCRHALKFAGGRARHA
jgi:hypothetical protein